MHFESSLIYFKDHLTLPTVKEFLNEVDHREWVVDPSSRIVFSMTLRKRREQLYKIEFSRMIRKKNGLLTLPLG